MKNILIYSVLIFILFLTNLSWAERLPSEKIVVQLSENQLLAGESLCFSVMVSDARDLPGTQISNRIFVELKDSENRSLIRQKILLDSGNGAGVMNIPDSLSSGTYYVVAYTNWMKNFGVENFSVSRIVVIKPGDQLATGVNSDSSEIKNEEKVIGNNFTISLNKKLFSTGEKARLNLSSAASSVSVSVRKKEYSSPNGVVLKTESNAARNTGEVEFLPDYKGILLSGFVRNTVDNQPLPNQQIYLTYPGKSVDMKYTVSEADGKFRFLIDPQFGEKDLVFNLESENAGLWLDEPFYTNPLSFEEQQSFELTNEQREFFKEKYINYQLKKKFDQLQKDEFSAGEQPDDSNVSFYDTPYQVLVLEDYIKLDSLHEYFYELIPTVHINRKKGQYKMYLTDPATNFSLGDNPGIFVDGVYYPYPGKLMDLEPELVERVEVLPKVYYYKEMTFDGIVSVFTKDKNFMDLPLQPDMARVYYQVSENEAVRCINGEINTLVSNKNHLPDLRWLLYWNNHIEIQNNETATIEFQTSDVKGEFEVSVKGFTAAGEIIDSRETFTVR